MTQNRHSRSEREKQKDEKVEVTTKAQHRRQTPHPAVSCPTLELMIASSRIPWAWMVAVWQDRRDGG